jgi:hypothetical protein
VVNKLKEFNRIYPTADVSRASKVVQVRLGVGWGGVVRCAGTGTAGARRALKLSCQPKQAREPEDEAIAVFSLFCCKLESSRIT